jgi:tRNA(fMet)-specific endonuclease VapC
MYMLDTNACIHVLRSRSDGLRHIFKAVEELCISSISYAELCFGVENGSSALRQDRWKQLDAFTGKLSIAPLGEEVGVHYGQIRACLNGESLGNNDLLIAAHARSMGAILVTNNIKIFRQVPDLKIENWL